MFNRVANTIASRFGTLETTQENAKYLPDHLYVNYLQAENMLRTGNTRWTEALISIYESILQEVPDFANAWSGLAEIEYRIETSPVQNFERPESAKRWLERARWSAERALQLDPGLAPGPRPHQSTNTGTAVSPLRPRPPLRILAPVPVVNPCPVTRGMAHHCQSCEPGESGTRHSSASRR